MANYKSQICYILEYEIKSKHRHCIGHYLCSYTDYRHYAASKKPRNNYPASWCIKSCSLDIRICHDGSSLYPLGRVPENAERPEEEIQMVLRRHMASDYTVLSHATYWYGQAAYARQDSSSRVVALWAWHRHEHHRHHSPCTRTSVME